MCNHYMSSTTVLRRTAIGALTFLTMSGYAVMYAPPTYAQTQANCVHITIVSEVPDAEEAQKQYVEGVKYYLEAKKTAEDPLVGPLMAKPVAEIAYASLSRAIELDPKLAMAYVYRAATSALLEKDVEAVMADLGKAAVADPQIYAGVQKKLESLFVAVGKLLEAAVRNAPTKQAR